jgi:aldose 1-epimerase
LEIEYNAETDKPTYANLTQHNYYNLSGNVNNTILNHSLFIDADNYTPVDTTLIPTGEIKAVKGSAFDFTKVEKIGARIDAVKGGYDHNWVLNKKDTMLTMVATLSDGKFINHDGKNIQLRTALCLETQHFPNSPNQPNFPSTLLKPGQKYHTVTKYKLSIQ